MPRCLIVAALLLTLAVVASAGRFVPEPLPLATRSWQKVRACPTAAELRLDASLAQCPPVDLQIALARDSSDWEAILLATSTPGSPRYGQHLSKQEVERLARPSDECVQLVKHWLQPIIADTDSVTFYAGHGDWVDVRGASAAQVGELLNTSFFSWSPPPWASSRVQSVTRAEAYSLPDELLGCVDMVAGVKHLEPVPPPKPIKKTNRRADEPRPSSRASDPLQAQICPGPWFETIGVCPQLLRQVWNVPANVTGSSTNNMMQAVAEFNSGELVAVDG